MISPESTSREALAEPEQWATALSNRLSLLQESMSQETPENRQAYLEEELRRSLQSITASKRGLYLNAFAEKSPAWDFGAVLVRKTIAGAPQTSEQVIKSFFEVVPELSGEEREAVKQKLAELGLLMTSSQPFGGDALLELQAKLKLLPTDRIDLERLTRTFSALAEVMMTVDQLSWSVWRIAAPKSTIRRDTTQGDLRTMLRRALTGETAVTSAHVQKQLEATRQLVAGLLAGLSQAGKNFARRYQQRYSPDVIRAAVRAEGGGGRFLGKGEAMCWKKYLEVTSELTNTIIENDVQDTVVKYAEDLFRSAQK